MHEILQLFIHTQKIFLDDVGINHIIQIKMSLILRMAI